LTAAVVEAADALNTVPGLFEAVAARCSGLPAITDEGGTLRYQEPNTRANRLARRLAGASAGRPKQASDAVRAGGRLNMPTVRRGVGNRNG
jgi:non-ribosomal peptide synthetase component F